MNGFFQFTKKDGAVASFNLDKIRRVHFWPKDSGRAGDEAYLQVYYDDGTEYSLYDENAELFHAAWEKRA